MFSTIGKIIAWIGRHFLGMLFLLIVLVVFMPKGSPSSPANLQEIKLAGPIINSDAIVKEIESAHKDKSIKGVLLSVDSPGGAVSPSIEISYAIKALKRDKPVIAYASGIMASGSYYASIYADQIIANPGAIVGSIGVIMEGADIKELMDKIGIRPQIVQQGIYKQAGTPMRPWTPQERAELEQLTKDTYNLFVSDVAKARRLDINNSKAYADAHIFSAHRAKEVGLIDLIGVKSEAKEILKKRTKVKKPVWKEKDKIQSFIDGMTQETILQIQSYFYGLKATL